MVEDGDKSNIIEAARSFFKTKNGRITIAVVAGGLVGYKVYLMYDPLQYVMDLLRLLGME